MQDEIPDDWREIPADIVGKLEDSYRRVNEARTVDYYNTGVLAQFSGIPVYHREGRWYVSRYDLHNLQMSNLAAAKKVQGLDNWDITDVETGESARTRHRGWHVFEESETVKVEAWKVTCYFCGQVCESEEALQEHEDVCA